MIRRKPILAKSEIKEVTKNSIKAIEFPDETFNSKADLFSHLKSNENKIISLKKAAVKNSEGVSLPFLSIKDDVIKGHENFEEGFIYPIINTTKYLDSHNDVHLNKIWNKSVKEQKGNIYYLADHEMKLSTIIAFPKDVEISVQPFTWKELGKDLEGETEALMFKIPLDSIKMNEAKDIIKNKTPIQHSVSMQYVKIDLAMDSEAKEDKSYKKRFDKLINEIANKELAIENGYFWAVSEAKIFKEGSMLPFGSNDATPLIYPKDDEPSSKDTLRFEPLENTQKEEKTPKRRRKF